MLRYVFTNNRESGDAFNNSGLIDASARGSSFTSDNALSASLTSVLGSHAVSDFRFQVATRRAVFRTNERFGPDHLQCRRLNDRLPADQEVAVAVESTG